MRVNLRRRAEATHPPAERKIVAVLVVAAAVLGLVGLTSLQSTRALIRDAGWVAHSHLVLEQLEKILAQISRLESDQSRYLLTGDESDLVNMRGDSEPIAPTLAGLRELTRDNARQRHLVDRLEPLALRRIALRDDVLAIRRHDGLDAAVAMLRRNRGRHLMRQVRGLVDRMQRTEQRLLAQRAARGDWRAGRTLTTIMGGCVGALLVLAGMSLWIRRDLRAGKRAARDLHAVSERLDLALAAAQVGTWNWDLTSDTVLWDDYMHPLFGLAAGTFGGRYADFLALIHPDDHATLRDAVQRVLAGTSDFDTEYRVVWADGSVHVVAARGEVYRAAGGAPARMTGVCWDVTEERAAREDLRRLKEAADAANQAKSEFLTSMSHELRTPMNSIIGFSQLLLRSAKSRLDAEDLDALQTVQRNAHHLLTLINQVLDLSRVEAGKVTLAKSRFDLGVLAREVVQEASPLVGAKPIELAVTIPEVPLVVDADATRVRQILTNLTANAIKYTAAGSVTVLVESELDPTLGAVARVRVHDTGTGISAADQRQLFQRFARLDTEATRREGGTGLGLSLSQELARMHGGRIEVASDGRSGSTFVLTLPVGGRRAAAPVACVGAGAGAGSGALTILCVDHEPDVLVFLERTLREAAYHVRLARDVGSALAEAQTVQPDLVCVDGDLADDGGFALITAMRGLASLACVPVLMLAGNDGEARAIVGGARRHLAKPLHPDVLLASVAGVLANPLALVLVVDPEDEVGAELRAMLARQGIGVAFATSGAGGTRRLAEARPDVVVIDPAASGGPELLAMLLSAPAWRDVTIVVFTRTGLTPATVTALAARGVPILHKDEHDVVAVVRAVIAEPRPAGEPLEERAAS